MTVRSGQLRTPVCILRPVDSKDAVGAPQEAWPVFATVFARREPMQGREIWQAMQVSEVVPVRYTIRYLAGVTSRMRLQDGSRVFDIKSVMPDERSIEMTLLCEEVL